MQMVIAKQIICPSCGGNAKGLWPFGEGMCDKCLVAEFKKGLSLEAAKERVCECLYKNLEQLYR